MVRVLAEMAGECFFQGQLPVHTLNIAFQHTERVVHQCLQFAFCADSYFSICSTPMLPQQHVKDPGHSAKSADGRLQLNMHAPYICGFA